MSRFQRSKVAQIQVWINQRKKALGKLFQPRWLRKAWRNVRVTINRLLKLIGKLLTPKWLRAVSRPIRVALYRLQKAVIGTVAPKWLRSAGQDVSKKIRKAEFAVTKTGSQVTKTVAKSSVGTKFKELVRSGKILENRLVVTAKFIGSILAGLVPEPIRRVFRSLGRAFWKVFGVFFVFVGRWFKTRSYWQLVAGIPAFMMALPLAYCMIRMPFHTPAVKAKHYQRAAMKALQEDAFSEADLYYRKLSQLGAMNEVAEFQAAHNAFLSGDRTAAFTQMKGLAPTDQPGFPPAHVWMARWYLLRQSDDVTEAQAVDLAQRHVDLCLQRDPDNAAARALRARFNMTSDQQRHAVAELHQLSQVMPTEGVYLAKVYANSGDWPKARAEVEKVCQQFIDRIANGDDLEPYEFLTYADAYQVIGALDQVERVLQDGWQAHAGDEMIRDQLYQVLLTRADMGYRQRQGDPEDVVQRLLQAAQLKPDEEQPIVRLGEYTQAKNHFSVRIRQAVDEMLKADDTPALLYSVMGPIVYAEGDVVTAAEYLRQAIKHQPDDHFSLNNLAYVILQSGTRLEQALTLVDRALELDPGQAMYKETRGQILLQLGRFEEAVDDLIYALNGLGDLPEIHAALAEAYERLGRTELANRHRRP